jgi:dolichol-phosphate mannosyltransferase
MVDGKLPLQPSRSELFQRKPSRIHNTRIAPAFTLIPCLIKVNGTRCTYHKIAMIVTSPQKTAPTDQEAIRLSLVVPCFNEEIGLDQLADRIEALRIKFHDRLDVEVVFVDDGSTDLTWQGLKSRFERFSWCKLVQHPQNLGITASIQTGILHSSNEFVASIDADCTYDPIQVMVLVELMTSDVAMVTASPYHPLGKVVGVPRWRLALSRFASSVYSFLLGTSLHTYTSCFRLHRRSIMTQLPIRESGFVGIAEMLWQVQLSGGRIVEAPACLTSRKLGFSKMRTLPVILAHLRLMLRIFATRISRT